MTLSEPHGRHKDHSITEQGCPNVMMAISVSPPQSSDSGGICVIGVQLSIWQCFHQPIDLILSFPEVGSGFFLFPRNNNLDAPSGGPHGLDHRGILGNEIHANKI